MKKIKKSEPSFYFLKESQVKQILENNKEIDSVLSTEELLAICISKCQDFGIEFNEKIFERFRKKQIENVQYKVFDMQNCSLGMLSGKIVAQTLFNHNHFKVLYLGGNNIGDEGAKFFAQLLYLSNSLVTVDLSSNSISSKGCGYLFQALQRNKTLISLNIGSSSGVNRNSLGPESIKELSRMLSINKVLIELNLSMAEITPDYCNTIKTGLSQNTTLSVLNLSNNNIQTQGAASILESLQYSNLSELDLSHNHIMDDSAPHFSQMLLNNRTLKVLKISHNMLSSKFFASISKALAQDKILTSLNISKNPITTKGLVSVGYALALSTSLVILIAQACKIDSNGFSEFAEFLGKNHGLATLQLNNNPIRDDGAKYLASAIANQTGLKELDLSFCEIGDKGCNALCNSIKSSTKVEKLFMKNNLIKIGGPILQMISSNSNIRELVVEFNDIDYKTLCEIQRITNVNEKKWNDEKQVRLFSTIGNQSILEERLLSVRKDIIKTREDIEDLTYLLKQVKIDIIEVEERKCRIIKELEERHQILIDERKVVIEEMMNVTEKEENSVIIAKNEYERKLAKLTFEQQNYKADSSVYLEISKKVDDKARRNKLDIEKIDRQLAVVRQQYNASYQIMQSSFQQSKQKI